MTTIKEVAIMVRNAAKAIKKSKPKTGGTKKASFRRANSRRSKKGGK